ncbi:MAG: hypothetical protein K1X67_03510 [Fimbriimonadaceae bacterium]|nr:hypothetical protein [Fimbriimonadaceae bacterium]
MTYKFNRTCLSALCAILAGAAFAAPFTPGNVVVTQIGDGAAAPTGAANQVYLKEYTLGGTLVQTITVNGTGSAPYLTMSGTATSEGFLTLGGGYLWFGGYNAAVGTQGGVAVGGAGASTSIPNSGSSIITRVAGRCDMNGNVDLSTQLGDAWNQSNIRSITSDGTTVWGCGTNGSGQNATGGVRSFVFGGTTSTQVSASPTNVRVVNIADGQLYGSASSGTHLGVFTVGTGLPLGPGETSTLLPGLPDTTGTGNASVYDYAFVGGNTVYMCDDRSIANGGGLVKWTLNAGVWSLAYKLTSGLGTVGVRSIARIGGPDSAPVFAVITGEGSGAATRIMTITDDGSGLNSFLPVATSDTNTAFRGVEVIPAPSGRPISGNVFLSDFGADPAGRQVTVELFDGVNVVDTQVVALDSSGNYSLTTSAPAGTYDVFAKSSHWLRKVRGSVVVSAGGATGVDFSLTNGDCNDDNEVGIGDFAILSAAYNSNLGDPGYSDGADLNGDEAVDIADYAILSSNYGLSGD